MKPIKIVKVKDGYNIFVRDVPVVKDGKGVGLDRQKAGLSTSGFPNGYKAPAETEPILIKTASNAASLAHQICRYVLDSGDFVASYTELVGIDGDHSVWWDRATH